MWLWWEFAWVMRLTQSAQVWDQGVQQSFPVVVVRDPIPPTVPPLREGTWAQG